MDWDSVESHTLKVKTTPNSDRPLQTLKNVGWLGKRGGKPGERKEKRVREGRRYGETGTVLRENDKLTKEHIAINIKGNRPFFLMGKKRKHPTSEGPKKRRRLGWQTNGADHLQDQKEGWGR